MNLTATQVMQRQRDHDQFCSRSLALIWEPVISRMADAAVAIDEEESPDDNSDQGMGEVQADDARLPILPIRHPRSGA